MLPKHYIGFLFLFYGMVYSCKEQRVNEIDHQPIKDADLQATIDTEVKPIEELSLSTPNRVAWQKPKLIINLLGTDLQDKIIADIGAGPTGFFTFELAQQGARVLAIDIDPNALSYIETNKNKLDVSKRELIRTRLAKPEDPNLKSQEIDGILMVNTITYIQNKGKYLSTLKSKLKEGGRLVIVDFKMKRLPEQIAPVKSQRIYADRLEEMLYEAGYKNIVVDDQALNFQYIITADK